MQDFSSSAGACSEQLANIVKEGQRYRNYVKTKSENLENPPDKSPAKVTAFGPEVAFVAAFVVQNVLGLGSGPDSVRAEFDKIKAALKANSGKTLFIEKSHVYIPRWVGV